MRTTIDLPEPLLKNAKQRASERGATHSVLLQDDLLAHLARNSAPPKPGFQLHTVRGRRLRPGIDLDRTSALITGDDELEFLSGKR